MFKRNLSLAACVCFAAMVVFGQTSYVFQLPGANGQTTQIVGLGDNDFSRFVTNPNGPAGAFQVLATPNGGKFFIVSSGGIQSAPANASLSPLTPITGISGTVTSAGITPDGKYLLVVADHFYIIQTSNNNIVQIDTGIPGGSVPVAFAVSRDSQTVWALADITSGSALGAVNLTTFQSSQFLFFPYPATSVTLSPLGLLYVTFTGDQLYEVDPGTMSVTPAGHIQIPSGLFGPLRFTPDGTTAYSVNRNAPLCAACVSIFMLNVAAHSASGWPAFPDPNNPPQLFDDVFVAGSSQIYAFASTGQTTKLWDVTPSPFSAVPSALGAYPNGPGLPINNVLAVAVSNERPSARFLYLLISNGDLLRVNIAASNLDSRTSTDLSKGITLGFTPIPAQSGGISFYTLNRTLNVQPGAASSPLIGQVLDSLGRPVVGVPVCFSTDPNSGLVITTPSQVTNADGWVQSTIVAPAQAGTYTVTLSAGTGCPSPGSLTSTTFTITVGTSTTGNSQISIYSGDAQLLRQANSTTQTQPLTVKITNTDGTPIAGAPVGFSVTQGLGLISPIDSVTDENGLYRANFITSLVDQSHAFQSTTVTASSAYGSVDFIETTHNASPIDAGQPGVLIITPQNQQLTIAQGGVLLDGVSAKTTSGHFPQAGIVIPNIGIRMADPDIADSSKVLSCQGSSRGGDDGISHCNIIAACQPAGTLPQTFSVVAAVGEYAFYPLLVTVTQGTGSLLSIVSGNNQVGSPQSSFTLLAKVTDGCNQNVNGVTVSWTVTQGSASLTQVQTVSSNNGTVSARVTLGSAPGPVRVTVSAPGLSPVVFNLTTQVPVSGVFLVSGGGQNALINQPFANPVVFVVRDTSNNPIPGLLVNFSVAGNATATPTSATTNAQGQVQTNVTAGATTGNVVITATYNGFIGTANLVVQPPGPQVTGSSFKNAASGVVGMTPCGLVTVIGNGIAPTVQGTVSALQAGLTITANGITASILSVSNVNGVQSANFQAPCELSAGNANVVVTANTSSTIVGVPVFAVQPGIFVVDSNKQHGWVVRADGNLVTITNPARRGDHLFAILTGLGQTTTPAIVTGSPGTGLQNVNLSVGVQVSGNGVPVPSARYLAGFLGAYIVEFEIPSDSPIGLDQTLLIAEIVNGVPVYSNQLLLPAVIAQ